MSRKSPALFQSAPGRMVVSAVTTRVCPLPGGGHQPPGGGGLHASSRPAAHATISPMGGLALAVRAPLRRRARTLIGLVAPRWARRRDHVGLPRRCPAHGHVVRPVRGGEPTGRHRDRLRGGHALRRTAGARGSGAGPPPGGPLDRWLLADAHRSGPASRRPHHDRGARRAFRPRDAGAPGAGGRLPDPDRLDEVVLNQIAADDLGLGVGDDLELESVPADQLEAFFTNQPFDGDAPNLHHHRRRALPRRPRVLRAAAAWRS